MRQRRCGGGSHPSGKPHLWDTTPRGLKAGPTETLWAPEEKDSCDPHPFQAHKTQLWDLHFSRDVQHGNKDGKPGDPLQGDLHPFLCHPQGCPHPTSSSEIDFTPKPEAGICSFCLIQPLLPLLPKPFQGEILELKLAGIRSSAGLPPSHTLDLFFRESSSS